MAASQQLELPSAILVLGGLQGNDRILLCTQDDLLELPAYRIIIYFLLLLVLLSYLLLSLRGSCPGSSGVTREASQSC